MDPFPVSRDLLGKSASAYEHLRRAIGRGQLRPDRRLSATGLAAAFKISETPVREALVRLSAEGFLAWEPSKGYFTKPVTLEEQTELLDVTAILLDAGLQNRRPAEEPDVLVLIPQRLALAGIEPRDLTEAGDQVVDLAEAAMLGIISRTENKALSAIMSVIVERTHLVRRLDLDAPERVNSVRIGLEQLVASVLGGDLTAARANLRRQLADDRRRLPALVGAAERVMSQATYP